MIVYYIFTGSMLAKAVKLETSLLAVRRKQQNADGTTSELLDELVMDEQYEILFKRLMNDAHADVMLNISSNMLLDTPTDMENVLTEFPDFRQDKDFTLWLNMHCDWPQQYRKSVDIKLQQYLIDYICYRWLETKSPNDAATYYSRLSPTIEDVKRLLVRKSNPIRIYPTMY
jgi:hypothetical protein